MMEHPNSQWRQHVIDPMRWQEKDRLWIPETSKVAYNFYLEGRNASLDIHFVPSLSITWGSIKCFQTLRLQQIHVHIWYILFSLEIDPWNLHLFYSGREGL